MAGRGAEVLLVAALVACGGPRARVPVAWPPTVDQAPPADAASPADAAPPVAPAALDDAVTPTAYRLTLELDPSTPTYRGEVEIDVTLARAQRTLWLHAGSGLTIEQASVVIGAAALPATVTPTAVTPTAVTPTAVTPTAVAPPLPPVAPAAAGGGPPVGPVGGTDIVGLTLPRELPAGPATLRLVWTGRYRTQDALFTQTVAGEAFAWSDFEPADARHAFPCFDEPRWRAPFTVTLHTPDGVGAYSNTPEVSSTREGRWTVRRFATTPPLPTYLVAVAAGRFVVHDVPGAPVPTRVLAPPGLDHVEQARALVGPITAAAERYLGRPWPWPKLDVVVVPSFDGAMENPGLITVAGEIAVGPVDAAARANLALVLAHELCHAWFGTYVTPRTWTELWLNEGFATWMSDRVLRSMDPPLRSAAASAADWLALQVVVQGRGGRPLRPPSVARPRAMFDAISYQGGGAVLQQLTAWLGEPALVAALGRYLDQHPWGTVTSDDLIAAVRAIDPDQPVAAVIEAALAAAARPALRLRLACRPGRAAVVVEPLGDPRPVPVCVRWGSAAGDRRCAVVTGPRELDLGGACPAWVTPVAELDASWQVPAGAWPALATAPLSEAERTRAVGAVVDAAAAGAATGDDVLAVLVGAVAAGQRAPLEAAALPLRRVAAVATDRGRAELRRRLGPAITDLLRRTRRSPTAGEPADRAATRALALELAGALLDDRAPIRWAERTTASWLRGAPVATTMLAPALAVTAVHGSRRTRARLLAAATQAGPRAEALAPALGRALASYPDATVLGLVQARPMGVPPAVAFELLRALLEDPRRAPVVVGALGASAGALLGVASLQPCAAVAGTGRAVDPRRVAAAARCQAFAAAVAR
ncbi:MAG: M1 family metallopeptidase [Kofleriaceae bacterium]